MKPPSFEYFAARSLDEALEQLDRDPDDAKVLAGGQSLVPLLSLRLAYPSLLVDINRIPGLACVREEGGALRVGALARHRALEKSPLVRDRWPILAEAAEHVGHTAIRNRGSFGGSLAHADPAAEWPMLAVLLEAEVVTRRTSGENTYRAEEFFVTHLTTALDDAEIVTEVRIPEPSVGTGWGFEEFSRRPGDFAIAAVGALVALEGSVCREARIGMAGVGPTPLRATQAEAMLRGRQLDREALKEAGARAREASDPTGDVHGSADYRRHLVGVLTERALAGAMQRATAT